MVTGVRVVRMVPNILVLIVFSMMIGSTFAAYNAIFERESRLESRNKAQLKVPKTPPRMTQDSIDFALKLYNIKIPRHVKHPTLDLSMPDRGLTVMEGLGRKLEVKVGVGAFGSWALLGSTLAHEIEVHCHQNFSWIKFRDLVGLEGTKWAEREAYTHEIDNAKRFGLDAFDVENIEQTMEFYYSEDKPSQEGEKSLANMITHSVQSWLAKHLLISE